MPHNVGDTIRMAREDQQAFRDALNFVGDRLVLKDLGGGWVQVQEYKGRRRLFKGQVLTENAQIMAEEFEENGGEVVWK